MKRRQFAAALLAVTFICSAQANSQTYYCAETTQIIFTPQSVSWAAYRYNALQQSVSDGLQPALMGEGNAQQAVKMQSAVWTDGALACNYDGLTDKGQPETMVLVSDPLSGGGDIQCQFPTNAGKTFCDSSDPMTCPLVCEDIETARRR